MLPERELQRVTPESRVCLEGTTTRVRMSYGVAESELLTEDTVLRRVQGAMSYKFRIGLDVNKEVNGNPGERSSGCEPIITGRGVSSEQVSDAQVAS
jgi:hypothetical protein